MLDRSEIGFRKFKPFYFKWLGSRWGFEFSSVGLGDTPYLDRYILYAFGGTLRLHKFWRGDDLRAPHDHPWWFITFPLRTYQELVEQAEISSCDIREVKAFRFHFRPATYRHVVLDPDKPFWTIVVTGSVERKWGFWPELHKFIWYRDWPKYVKEKLL